MITHTHTHTDTLLRPPLLLHSHMIHPFSPVLWSQKDLWIMGNDAASAVTKRTRRQRERPRRLRPEEPKLLSELASPPASALMRH